MRINLLSFDILYYERCFVNQSKKYCRFPQLCHIARVEIYKIIVHIYKLRS